MPRSRYQMTRADLVKACPLLKVIEVVGSGKNERLRGRNYLGEIVVQTPPGKVTPAKVTLFNDLYSTAVARGLIKPAPKGEPRPDEQI